MIIHDCINEPTPAAASFGLSASQRTRLILLNAILFGGIRNLLYICSGFRIEGRYG